MAASGRNESKTTTDSSEIVIKEITLSTDAKSAPLTELEEKRAKKNSEDPALIEVIAFRAEKIEPLYFSIMKKLSNEQVTKLEDKLRALISYFSFLNQCKTLSELLNKIIIDLVESALEKKGPLAGSELEEPLKNLVWDSYNLPLIIQINAFNKCIFSAAQKFIAAYSPSAEQKDFVLRYAGEISQLCSEACKQSTVADSKQETILLQNIVLEIATDYAKPNENSLFITSKCKIEAFREIIGETLREHLQITNATVALPVPDALKKYKNPDHNPSSLLKLNIYASTAKEQATYLQLRQRTLELVREKIDNGWVGGRELIERPKPAAGK